MSKLGEEATIIMGQSPPGDSYNEDGVGAPLLNGPTEFGAVHPVEKQWTTSPTKFCEAGDVLFCVRGATAGRLNSADKRYCIGRGLAAIRGKAGRSDSGFLRYVLASGYATFQLRGVGSTFINISGDELAAFPVPAFPLAEQRRIAEILDEADALRAKRRAVLAQLNALTQSIFLDMFGDPTTNPKRWPVPALGTLLRDVTNGMTRRRAESDAGQSIVLRLRDVRDGWIDFSDVNRITLTSTEAEKYEVAPGDLLFIRVNGNPDYVGRCAHFHGYPERVYFNDHVMRVRIHRAGVDGVFLAFLLNSAHGKREIAKHRKTSAGQHTINQDGLSRIRVPLPPLLLQRSFVDRVAAVVAWKRTNEICLQASDQLLASLQHRAFRGEL